MKRASKIQPVLTTAGNKGEIIKLMRGLAHRHDLWRVFSDFCEISAVSIANAVDRPNPQSAAREARYMEIVKAYSKDELPEFSKMLYYLTEALSCSMDDVLGEVFMEMDLGSKWHGQFFTPYEICRLMASLNVGDELKAMIARRGFVTANEPACGGGAMMIAMAEEMQAAGINYQQCLHVTAQDLDLKAVHMAYIQLSLLHIPAVVVHGNTLTNEQRSHWFTPAHIMGGWNWRLRARELEQEEHVETEEPPQEYSDPAVEPDQPKQAQAKAAPSAWQQQALI